MTTALPTAEQVFDLPGDLREPLHSLSADIRYLFGRVAADGTLASMMADSAVSRLSLIEEASYRLNAHITAQAAEIERLTNEYMEARATLSMWSNKNAELTRTAHANLVRAIDAEGSLAAVKAERDALREALMPFAGIVQDAESFYENENDHFYLLVKNEAGGETIGPFDQRIMESAFRNAVAALSLDAEVKRKSGSGVITSAEILSRVGLETSKPFDRGRFPAEMRMTQQDVPHRTDEDIIRQTNDLARISLRYIGTGYEVPEGWKFYAQEDPRSRKAWQFACEAQELLTATDPNDALSALDVRGEN